MDPFEEFVSELLYEGRVVFRGKPETSSTSRGAAAALGRAYAAYRLDVAGPAIAFDAGVALEAAELVRQACWALVNREEGPERIERRLTMSVVPRTAAHHLSADLVFRHLAQVHRRARTPDPTDVLPVRLAEVLRQWPLSGVLADLEEGPSTPPDLGGHEGLLLLYAERLARHDRPAWRPSRKGIEYLELVLAEAGTPARPARRDGHA